MEGFLWESLAQQAAGSSDSIAILAPNRIPLTYGQLNQQVQSAAETLRHAGIGRGRVAALALSNGPEMGTAFLSALTAGVALPLNPNAPVPEIERCLKDSDTCAVIVPAGADVPARQAALNLDITLVELAAESSGPAGLFDLHCIQPISSNTTHQLPENLAMLMFTGGTTGRSKIVTLTTSNLQVSVANFQRFACLTRQDRELNVMPMFHVQGLLVAFLSTILSGGSIVCTPGFDPASFFDWFEEYKPTWFSASPTILQTISNRAAAHSQQLLGSRLRFIRCSAAPLPLAVHDKLEKYFKAPVSESLGMTEAAGAITQNPLPPANRKPGTVGCSIGNDLAIMEETGSQFLPLRVVGEIVVRGPGVTQGYLDAPEDNVRLFNGAWLRTGDQGMLDADGFLTITGRLKEIILRAGESISPYEVEEVLYQHPAVSQAVVFGMPDPILGEAVAAAVVLSDPAVNELSLQNFVAGYLANSKIPERIVILDAIPKSTVGKFQRAGLAEKLNLTGRAVSSASFMAPRNEIELTLAGLWKKVLGLPEVGINQRFLDLGGDSLLAIRLMAEVQQMTGQDLPITALLQYPTISDLAGLIAGNKPGVKPHLLVRLQAGDSNLPPLIWVGYLYAHIKLSEYLKIQNPIYGLQFDLSGELIDVSKSFPEMAAGYIEEIQRLHPKGPYLLGGWSLGGFLAYEIACQFQAAGERILFLGLLDTAATNLPSYRRSLPLLMWLEMSILQLGAVARFHLSRLVGLRWPDRMNYIWSRIWKNGRLAVQMQLAGGTGYKNKASQPVSSGKAKTIETAKAEYDLKVKTSSSYRNFIFKKYPGELTLFRVARPHLAQPEPAAFGWKQLVSGGVEVEVVPGDHDTIVEEPHVQVLAEKISDCIRKKMAA